MWFYEKALEFVLADFTSFIGSSSEDFCENESCSGLIYVCCEDFRVLFSCANNFFFVVDQLFLRKCRKKLIRVTAYLVTNLPPFANGGWVDSLDRFNYPTPICKRGEDSLLGMPLLRLVFSCIFYSKLNYWCQLYIRCMLCIEKFA